MVDGSGLVHPKSTHSTTSHNYGTGIPVEHEVSLADKAGVATGKTCCVVGVQGSRYLVPVERSRHGICLLL